MSDVQYRDLDFAPFAPGYRVGSDGTVWSRKNARWGLRDQWRKLSLAADSNGYPMIRLMCSSKRPRTFRVHVLVLLAFVGERPANADACHINGNRSDPRLANLRWDTRRENVRDAERHGTRRRGGGHPSSKLTDEQIAQIRSSSEPGTVLARRHNVSQATISRLRHLEAR